MYNHLYIHIPFCSDICDFCNLYSVSQSSKETKDKYLEKLANDFKKNHLLLSNIKTIFIGGGTPLILSLEQIETFFCLLRRNFKNFSGEFTVECNPKNTTEEKLKVLRFYGVNRLSFGGQSHLPHLRNIIGRRNKSNDLLEIIAKAKKLGFKNINVDLIFGIPSQSLKDWRYDLCKTLDLDIQHLSTYSLSINPDTKLFDKKLSLNPDKTAEMFILTDEVVEEYGFSRYEVSNFSLGKSFQCRHNYGVWKGETYLGLGASAVSFDGNLRWQEIANTESWLKNQGVEKDEIPPIHRSAEIFFTGLRTSEGWQIKNLKKILPYEKYLQMIKPQLEYLQKEELLKISKEKIMPTKRGLLFADTIAEEVLVDI